MTSGEMSEIKVGGWGQYVHTVQAVFDGESWRYELDIRSEDGAIDGDKLHEEVSDPCFSSPREAQDAGVAVAKEYINRLVE